MKRRKKKSINSTKCKDQYQRKAEFAKLPGSVIGEHSKANRIRKLWLNVVKKAGPKIGAVMGGPIGMGIAAASTMMDVKDAYALGESTMNPKTEEDMVRQKHLADMMRRNEFY